MESNCMLTSFTRPVSKPFNAVAYNRSSQHHIVACRAGRLGLCERECDGRQFHLLGKILMSNRALLVAFVEGGMYEPVYERLSDFEKSTNVRVEIAFRGSHPALNAHLASLSQVPYDLVSTHTKYAPSQLSFLAPIDAIADDLEINGFYSQLIDLARVEGQLFGIPRNIDVKLLHYRTDLIECVPRNWNELIQTACRLTSESNFYGFVFPGMESGLFGMFYELAEMGGARLFPRTNTPELNNEGGRWALDVINTLYRSHAVPKEITNWHYDEVHTCFRKGHAAMVCDWPGYYGAYCDAEVSAVRDRFALARMPAGPSSIHKAYSGCHTFALTRRGVDYAPAQELLRFLNAPEQQLAAARAGSVPTRPAVLAQILSEEVRSEAGSAGAARWKLLDTVIVDDMLIPPALSYYPEIEEIIWRTVRAAMTDEMPAQTALTIMERRIAECHQRNSEGD
jgi:multiple sugar transport system substrate-binding protein